MTDQETDKPERMQCMEIWGGNRAIKKHFEAPGLDLYVHSTPYKESTSGGGDIYYLTSCASGRISRFLLADVSGHGKEVSDIAVTLRNLMRNNVNKISQEQFVVQMNREFGEVADNSRFATAVVATFFEPTKKLTFNVAGHPFPLYYRSSINKWIHLDPEDTDNDLNTADDAAPSNLPLGILEGSQYPGRSVKTAGGDMFLLYSDAFIESVNQNDELLGIHGVLDVLNESDRLGPGEVIPFLRERIGKMGDGNLLDDDASLILGHFTSTKVKLRDNLMAPFRLLGSVSDNTQVGD